MEGGINMSKTYTKSASNYAYFKEFKSSSYYSKKERDERKEKKHKKAQYNY